MIINKPFYISSRLLPAITINDAEISLDRTAKQTVVWFDLDGESRMIDDFNFKRANTQECFRTILTFMSACADAIAYILRTGSKSENADLFEPFIAEWCNNNSDEIQMMECDIEEDGLIVD